MIQVAIYEENLAPWSELVEFQQQEVFSASQCGANAVFVGTMRDFNEGDDVRAMRLEHYPAMTQKKLETLVDEAVVTHGLNHVLLLHRVGDILPGDPIVLVSVWSAHRNAAFIACREIMEALKHQAPFWKQETLDNGMQRWVEKNTAG